MIEKYFLIQRWKSAENWKPYNQASKNFSYFPVLD